jgi:uncharacterized protein
MVRDSEAAMSAAGIQYVVLGTYRRGALALRAAAMAEHLAYLRRNRYRLRFAGPVLDDDRTAHGSFAIVAARDRVRAADFIEREAFHRAGMFDNVEIVRFASATGHRQANLAADPERPPSLPGQDSFARVLEGGVLLTDDGVRVVGGLFIIEATDRQYAERALALDVARWMVADAQTLVTRWRFGQALGGADRP